MLCQHCGKNQATTHIKTILNGEIKEQMLCSECAQKLHGSSWFDQLGLFGPESFLGSFFGNEPRAQEPVQETRCPKCGSSYSDIVRSGKVGCADCYSTFRSRLLPLIQRIHGNTKHTGKMAGRASAQAKLTSKLEQLKNQLNEAIQQQEFEKAAQLRDQIKEMEGEQHA